MPSRPVTQTANKKKKRSRLSRFASGVEDFDKRFARGAEDAVTGFPTGVVSLARALDTALPKSFIPGVDEGHRQSYEPIKKIGAGMLEQTKQDIRHPLRDPFSTTLSLLGLASFGVGASARVTSGVSKVAKTGSLKAGAKAAARPRPATRKIKTIKRPASAQKKIYTSPSGKKITQTVHVAPKQRELEVEANPNPLVRGARKITLDPLYDRSRLKAEADFDNPRAGRYARMVERRTMDQRNRYAENIEDTLNKRAPAPLKPDPIKDAARLPMDLMRLSMYTRPRYYIQNLGGTAQLAAHMGVSPGDVKKVREIAKTRPELYQLMRAAGGETGTKAVAMGTGSGRVGKAARWAGEKANLPESHMRTVGVFKAAKDYGLDDLDELERVLRNPHSNEAQLIMSRANEALVDYGRVGGTGTIGRGEKKFVDSGLPIFYPMFKGFTRYAGRFPTQHPYQSMGIEALGEEGKETQRKNLGGEPQPWFPYISPVDGNKTLNLQNLYGFSPGMDVARQGAQALPGAQRHPTLNLLQALGPLAELGVGAVSGRQLATGFEYDEDTLDKYGSFATALGDTAKSVVPGMEYLGAVPGLESLQRSSAAYGEPSLEKSLMLALLGPGLVRRETNYKKVIQPKKKKPGRPRRHGSARF